MYEGVYPIQEALGYADAAGNHSLTNTIRVVYKAVD